MRNGISGFPTGVLSAEELHGVAEQPQAVALLGHALACPARVLRRQDVALGVRHQAEDAAADVAQAGDVALRAVGVVRILRRLAVGADVAEDDLAGALQALEYPGFPANKAALAVSD